MNALSDIGDILTAVLDGLPWPALLVNEQGEVTFINQELNNRGGAPGVARPRLSELFPEYYAALRGEQPWLTPQDVDVIRAQSGIHERLCLRRLPFGACLVISERSFAREFDLGRAQTARLAALGFMVAGVCHEVANPLTAIHSMAQLLCSSKPLPPETLERGLANIMANVRRVLNITRKLNDFSHAGSQDKTPLSLDQPITEALQNVRENSLFQGIEVTQRAGEELWILGHSDQLEQVFANILLNAAQAMKGAGRIAIAAHRITPSMAEITVHDSGPGIAPGHLPRLFEPFFTTKSTGQGTGLGLAISNEIVVEHGGSLRAENHPGGGACLYVTLPLHQRRP
jgi:two-component system NtrC family sensor kinase